MNATLAASAAAVAALAMVFGSASAQLFPPTPPPAILDTNNTISVTGAAETKVEPDRVMITLAVETTADTPGEALRQNSETMDAVLDALAEAGVPENDTSTAYFAIYPKYDYNFTEFGPQQEQQVSGYTASNSIMIESSNLSNVSNWLDAAVGAGANRIDSVVFTVSKERMGEIRLDLMQQATDDARGKADALASALDVEITGVRAAGLSDFNVPVNPFSQLGAAFDFGAAAPPILPADQTVTATVTVIYEIG
jgi:uncharacterized protein YggE